LVATPAGGPAGVVAHIPAGSVPGQQLQVTLLDGRPVVFAVPDGIGASGGHVHLPVPEVRRGAWMRAAPSHRSSTNAVSK
jgi:hypothetical protein